MTKDLALKILGALLLAALAVALVFGTVKGYEHWRDAVRAEGDTAGAARVRALWDEDRSKAQAQRIEDDRIAAAETLRRLNKQQENDRAQQALLAQVRHDRDAAVAAADGLRLRAAAYLDAAGCGHLSGDSALGCVQQAAAALADALGRSAAIAQRAAADADDARARGLKCEADYDALTLKPTGPQGD
jgi:predicted membrane chloride channel (bestrophin family)